MTKKTKKFRCLRDFERHYLPKTYAERLKREEEERLGLGGVLAKKMLEAKRD